MKSYFDDVNTKGFCLVKNFLSNRKVQEVNENLEKYLKIFNEGVVYEKNSSFVRAIHGPHLYAEFFLEFARNDFLVDFAKEYLSDHIYIHQYKINMKRAMSGESWPWHQDYVYWRENDYIENPQLLNAAIALDDITMLNGPICVIPGSHKLGDITEYSGVTKGDWSKDVSSDLTYKIDKTSLAPLLEKNSYELLVCNAGDIILFSPLLAHASSNNMSPFDRRLMIITYNAVSNSPLQKSKRPAFLSAVDYSPIT